MTESRTATNALLGTYTYNERGLRVKAERFGQPMVQVVRPNGGESLYLGALDTISWNGMGLAGALVKLELLVGGAVAGTIAENLPGTQTSFQWQVGKTLTGTVNPGSDYKVPSTECVVRVSAAADPDINDSSDGSFSITVAPLIAVISPNGGEQWQRGTTQIITWTSSNVTNVKIQLLKGTVVNSTITSSTPAANGSYSWTIPASQAVATNYKIRITSTASSAVTDSSDASFSIFAPSITVTAPAAGANWQRGILHTINWTKLGTMNANVKIQLIKGTSVNSTLATSTPNDGSFDWTIPAGQALAATYKIRIITVDNLVTGNSGTFSITSSGGLTLLSPNDGELVPAAATFPVCWTVDPAIHEVKLEYSRDNGGSFMLIADNVPNTGYYEWAVPVSFTSNGIIRISDSYGKNWLNEYGVLETTFSFNCSSQKEKDQPDFAVWHGGSNVNSSGYEFARVAVGRDSIRMAEVTQTIETLSDGWHEVKIRVDLKRDLGSLFIDDRLVLENVAVYTSKMHHFEPYLTIRVGGGAETDLLLGIIKFQVVLFNIDGSEQDRFTVLNEDFSGYDSKQNVISNCWQLSGLRRDKAALEFKPLPGTGQALQLHVTDGMSISICKPLAIPEKVPFDISDRSFSIEMRQEKD